MSSIPAASEPAAASSEPENGIPRPIYLGRVLWLCFFPVFTVLVGDFVLIFVAQAREALVAFNDEHARSQLIVFALSYALWMVSAWYVARLLLGKRFEPDLLGQCTSPVFARNLALRLPQGLALVAALTVPGVLLYRIVFYGQSDLWLVVLSLLVACAIVPALIELWRSWQGLRFANFKWTEWKWNNK